MYIIEIWEESYVFQRRYKKSTRSQSCIHFLQFPTRRHSIRPYIMNILNETNTRTYCTDKKYATYQLNNRTFSTQNTKISARSLAISYIYFQVRIVKKKGGGEAILSTTTENLVTPAPPTPDKGSIREIGKREKLHFLSLLTTILKALICWKLERASGGSAPWAPGRGFAPWHPARGPTAGPWTPPV